MLRVSFAGTSTANTARLNFFGDSRSGAESWPSALLTEHVLDVQGVNGDQKNDSQRRRQKNTDGPQQQSKDDRRKDCQNWRQLDRLGLDKGC